MHDLLPWLLHAVLPSSSSPYGRMGFQQRPLGRPYQPLALQVAAMCALRMLSDNSKAPCPNGPCAALQEKGKVCVAHAASTS